METPTAETKVLCCAASARRLDLLKSIRFRAYTKRPMAWPVMMTGSRRKIAYEEKRKPSEKTEPPERNRNDRLALPFRGQPLYDETAQ